MAETCSVFQTTAEFFPGCLFSPVQDEVAVFSFGPEDGSVQPNKEVSAIVSPYSFCILFSSEFSFKIRSHYSRQKITGITRRSSISAVPTLFYRHDPYASS